MRMSLQVATMVENLTDGVSVSYKNMEPTRSAYIPDDVFVNSAQKE